MSKWCTRAVEITKDKKGDPAFARSPPGRKFLYESGGAFGGLFDQRTDLKLFTDRITRESTNYNIFAEFRNLRRNKILNSLIRVLNERLIQQTDTTEILIELTGDNLFDHVLRLSFHLV